MCVTRAAQHWQARIFIEARIDFGQPAQIESAAMRAVNDARVTAGGAQADWGSLPREVKIGSLGHAFKSRLPKS